MFFYSSIFQGSKQVIKLTSNWSRKVSDQKYGSKGAGCAVEVEVDGAMLERPEELRARLRRLFEICRLSVDEELATEAEVGHGHTTSNGNGNGTATSGNGRRRDGTRKATASQARALHAIADRQGINLAELLRQRFGVDQAGDLAIMEASQLIDELKGAGHGTGGRR